MRSALVGLLLFVVLASAAAQQPHESIEKKAQSATVAAHNVKANHTAASSSSNSSASAPAPSEDLQDAMDPEADALAPLSSADVPQPSAAAPFHQPAEAPSPNYAELARAPAPDVEAAAAAAVPKAADGAAGSTADAEVKDALPSPVQEPPDLPASIFTDSPPTSTSVLDAQAQEAAGVSTGMQRPQSGWSGALAIIAIVAAIGVGGVWLLRRRRQQTQYSGLREAEMAMIRHDL
ncbi:hypothetical protein WJX74_010271 [Apatococcus lobatus]|uniref:LPXTG cell wall anchor domain-containing protein n=2 Tax=Apatococcus TaxID=904362 RepID=A0AAW1SPD3_9CHLO